MTLEELRRLLGIVIPVHFQSEVDETTIRQVLEPPLVQLPLFCRPCRTVLVVDRDAAAERVLDGADPDSPLFGLPVERLGRNQGKTGAIRAGLQRLLADSEVAYIATRDCDGDGALEDLPYLLSLARQIERHSEAVAVFGVRESLFRPMSWEREQWEQLTNSVVEAMVDYALAARRQIQDRVFWNGRELDLQGGFRVYNRTGAALALAALQRVPDNPDLYLMANEIVPYVEISLAGGRIGQIPRKTILDQPTSSFRHLPFARCYGQLLAFLAEQIEVPGPALQQMWDNAMVNLPGYYGQLRESFMECRRLIAPHAPPPELPRVI